MGLEPTTFCMARTRREPTRSVTGRRTAWLSGIRDGVSDRNRQQATAEPD
jgi:hypothetical protein